MLSLLETHLGGAETLQHWFEKNFSGQREPNWRTRFETARDAVYQIEFRTAQYERDEVIAEMLR
jgi:hypothetical protein